MWFMLALVPDGATFGHNTTDNILSAGHFLPSISSTPTAGSLGLKADRSLSQEGRGAHLRVCCRGCLRRCCLLQLPRGCKEGKGCCAVSPAGCRGGCQSAEQMSQGSATSALFINRGQKALQCCACGWEGEKWQSALFSH